MVDHTIFTLTPVTIRQFNNIALAMIDSGYQVSLHPELSHSISIEKVNGAVFLEICFADVTIEEQVKTINPIDKKYIVEKYNILVQNVIYLTMIGSGEDYRLIALDFEQRFFEQFPDSILTFDDNPLPVKIATHNQIMQLEADPNTGEWLLKDEIHNRVGGIEGNITWEIQDTPTIMENIENRRHSFWAGIRLEGQIAARLLLDHIRIIAVGRKIYLDGHIVGEIDIETENYIIWCYGKISSMHEIQFSKLYKPNRMPDHPFNKRLVCYIEQIDTVLLSQLYIEGAINVVQEYDDLLQILRSK